jgi:hypothetical protein
MNYIDPTGHTPADVAGIGAYILAQGGTQADVARMENSYQQATSSSSGSGSSSGQPFVGAINFMGVHIECERSIPANSGGSNVGIVPDSGDNDDDNDSPSSPSSPSTPERRNPYNYQVVPCFVGSAFVGTLGANANTGLVYDENYSGDEYPHAELSYEPFPDNWYVAVPDPNKKKSSNLLGQTYIYRAGSGNATNLTPRPVDISGLSYYLTVPTMTPYTVTTIELINETGVLIAVPDGPNHVSVRTIAPESMLKWIESRPIALTHPYYLTTILQNISVKVK